MGNHDSKGGHQIEVMVRTKTFSKDSCGLFDRASKDYRPSEFELAEDATIALHNEDVVVLKREVKRKDVINLINLSFAQNMLIARHTAKQYHNLDSFDESKIKTRRDFQERFIWKALYPETGNEVLDINDVFRMGRLRFRVREVYDQKGNRSLGLKGIDKHIEYSEHENQDDIYCRVCMEPQNPAKEYANVCDCSKRMPIHADCLMDWVKTKMNKKVTETFEFYTWKGLECDICKKTYPDYFTANEKKYCLLAYDKPPAPYIVLDLYNREANTLKGCFVIKKAAEKALKIGRGQDCDIRLSDISISRNHSKFFYANGAFYIGDSKSKFGTMVLVQKDINFMPGSQGGVFQVGKCVIEICPKRVENKCMPICSAKQKPSTLRKANIVNLGDEPDYLSETIIEEREEAEKAKNQPPPKPPTQETGVIGPGNVNVTGVPSGSTQADANRPVDHSQHSQRSRGASNRQLARSPTHHPAQRPMTGPGQQNAGQAGPQMGDDDLFNGDFINDNGQGDQEDDFDFDFASSEEGGDQASNRNNPSNPRNFETSQFRQS